jgi:hypothetical protein
MVKCALSFFARKRLGKHVAAATNCSEASFSMRSFSYQSKVGGWFFPILFVSIRLSRYSDGLRAGRSGFDSLQGQGFGLFSTESRPALGPTQPPIQRVSGVKRPGHEFDPSI